DKGKTTTEPNVGIDGRTEGRLASELSTIPAVGISRGSQRRTNERQPVAKTHLRAKVVVRALGAERLISQPSGSIPAVRVDDAACRTARPRCSGEQTIPLDRHALAKIGSVSSLLDQPAL